MNLFTFFQMGGFFMWPLLIFSIATLSIAIERIIYLFYHNLRVSDMESALLECIKKKDIDGAKAILASRAERRMVVPILSRLLDNSHLGEHIMEKTAETESAAVITRMENGFDFLTALGSLAPITGFLGTVSGMIGAFKSIAEATEVNAQIVASGIYEALITTVFGLIIAIIAMVASSLLTHIVDKFAADTEKACSEIITEFVRSKA
ncbi:MAG: MotA/TolQ/ExbB proton channel family protein [Spirochaetaceae bacterium]|jgi:biopolymer transport protein ExbB|nr:MotA/TolQ/ExbB proton channel family protein [Spirochaetaceae bacterium]